MTLEYLSQLHYTIKDIKHEENQLEMLRLRMTSINSRLTGMPSRSGVTDRIGELMPDIVDKTRKLDQLKLEFEIQRSRLEVEIRQIERIRIRLIFLLRFVDLKTWGEVASAIGGDDTDNSCKQACYRYLRGIEE